MLAAPTIIHGDCRSVLSILPGDDADSCVTDPPYELGFMGKAWDATGIANDPALWGEVLRVLKPGGHLLAFGGTRTHHRMMCAIEDAGFEIRDTLMWVYGSGFPKSHNGPWGGTALKPAWEPIILARKPLIGTVKANHAAHGVGALNIDGCRVGTESTVREKAAGRGQFPHEDDSWEPKAVTVDSDIGRWPANLIHDGSGEVLAAFPQAPGQQGDLKYHGKVRRSPNGCFGKMAPARDHAARIEPDKCAARFFYAAKASKSDRGTDNNHPTVKPTELMRYLCRLVTPVGGTVLDPFAGSGSTGKAAALERLAFVGIERDARYVEIARQRANHPPAHRRHP